MRRLLAATAILLTMPAAAAQGDGSEVEILDVRLPALVVADVPFDANVTLANRLGEPVTAYLYAVLYDGPGGPCGGHTSPRWRGLVSMSPGVASAPLAPREERTYPDPGRSEGAAPKWVWWWKVNATRAPVDGTYEACVFAMKDAGVTVQEVAQHYHFASVPLTVRTTNAPPTADFSWTPPTANVTTHFTFTGAASDADGDPVRLRWDFGHFVPAGRARGEGPVVSHRFYPDGVYTVTLTASDPYSSTTVAKEVRVLPEDVPTPEFEEAEAPTPAVAAAWTAVAGLAAAAWRKSLGLGRVRGRP